MCESSTLIFRAYDDKLVTSNKYIILKKIILYHNLSLFVAFGGQSFALIYMY